MIANAYSIPVYRPGSAPWMATLFLATLSLLAGTTPRQTRAETPAFTEAQLEFFEKQVRPLLVEHCQGCHGAKKQEGGLRLDSRAAILRGGDTGPAVLPGQPGESELIQAIHYDPDGYQMPPSGKLPAEAIAMLTRWVEESAPWPAESEQSPLAAGVRPTLTRDHWSLKPIQRPALPTVSQPEWTSSPVDAFILQRLDQVGLKPAPPASREILLRRAYYDLLGLPPTASQRARFLADERPDAFARLIDELLDSPHYGERWGRHWLDLVRFSETLGHEFDYEIQLAWKYRDYVIRALNEDLPMDDFLMEHLAGDLLAEPRRNPQTGHDESILGTGFLWFGQGKHSPVDVRAEQCDLIDNQIDVLTKTFLATTVACARCHDHKFDPVTIRDYYALSGILESSRRHYADLRPQAPLNAAIEQIRQLKQTQYPQLVRTVHEQLTEYLGVLASEPGLFPSELPQADQPQHPAHAWKMLQGFDVPAEFTRKRDALVARLDSRGQEIRSNWQQTTLLADFASGLPAGWTTTGQAFGFTTSGPELVCGTDPWKPVTAIAPEGMCHTGLASGRAAGTMRSPTFEITHPYIDYHLCRQAGKPFPGGVKRGPLKNGQAHLVIDGFQHIRSPIYGELSFVIPLSDQPVWHRQNVSKWIGHRAYIEFFDEEEGFLQIDQIRFSAGAPLAEFPLEALTNLLREPQLTTPAALREAYLGLFREALAALGKAADDSSGRGLRGLSAEQVALLNWLLTQMQRTDHQMPAPAWLDQFYVQRKTLEGNLGSPVLGLTTTEGMPLNSLMLVRGNPGKPAGEITRRFLEVLGGTPEQIPPGSSGRLELARFIVSQDNPLFDRVMVNRAWRAHFSEGLVSTPDDFGKMGQPPSHPELLDYLAAEFRSHGRSLKWLHRLLMNSATYQMSSDFRPEARDIDPLNRLWHRMPVRRLEGEAIRDTLLALSGGLKPELYGESIMPHLTPFMVGRGRPGASGPLDGNGRRSIYLSVRRNFLSPMFLAFDYPLPMTTAGRRSVSNVPAQALTLMNSEFAVQQTRYWAEKGKAAEWTDEERIRSLYREAFAREPTDVELQTASEFLREEGQRDRPPEEIWGDLCHVLINVKEFVFIR